MSTTTISNVDDRRIAACLKACEGIDTHYLEGFSPGYLKSLPDLACQDRLDRNAALWALSDLIGAVEQHSMSDDPDVLMELNQARAVFRMNADVPTGSTHLGSQVKDEIRNAAYVSAGGSYCPHCGSKDISSGEIEADGDTVTADVHCDQCNAEWTDVFRLHGFMTK